MFQLSVDKCPNGGKSASDITACLDLDYNVKTGAAFLASTIKNAGGNYVEAIGVYNGWEKGLTYAQATAAAKTSCCHCQNNLDYIFQTLGGWYLGIDPTSNGLNMGKYFNYNVCNN